MAATHSVIMEVILKSTALPSPDMRIRLRKPMQTTMVLLPSASMREIGNVPDDLAAVFDFISYRSAEKAVFKALGANPAIIADSNSYCIRTYASILSCKGVERVS